MTDLLSQLHQVSPYDGFDHTAYPEDLHGWGSDHPIFARLINEIRPSLICEVGVWKGASTATMAYAIRESRMDCKILSVDTWLGAVEFWKDQSDPERYQSLRLHHGYPRVYYQFLSNMVRLGFQDIVVPFPQTSSNAAAWLKWAGLTPQLVYVDASHEYDDVLQDIGDWWSVLAPGGVMFGDDYDDFWPDVKRAVDNHVFLTARFGPGGAEFSVDGNKWILRKC